MQHPRLVRTNSIQQGGFRCEKYEIRALIKSGVHEGVSMNTPCRVTGETVFLLQNTSLTFRAAFTGSSTFRYSFTLQIELLTANKDNLVIRTFLRQANHPRISQSTGRLQAKIYRKQTVIQF